MSVTMSRSWQTVLAQRSPNRPGRGSWTELGRPRQEDRQPAFGVAEVITGRLMSIASNVTVPPSRGVA